MHWILYQVPLALAALATARVITIDVEDDQVKLHNPLPQAFARCYWDGTSPFCAGSCDTRNGWVECGRDGTGNGATCVTGYKKYCCRESCSAGLTSESHNGNPRTTGDDPNDDYCGDGQIIVCPPGATKNEDCKCIKDPERAGSHRWGHY